MKRLTKEQFVDKANLIHNFKYDYSKVVYNGYAEKVCIVCPEHGEFWQTPGNHLKGIGCPECGKIKCGIKHRTSQENFINKARKIHGNKYDYSKVNYNGSHFKVCIISLSIYISPGGTKLFFAELYTLWYNSLYLISALNKVSRGSFWASSLTT